eukprot:TRINITY_DN425_c0_g1_i1.p2 TRINITY_DN425_c0_g1~~TRINITY_DN425_c0_g1_i1.p2  ORF type:complete len:228 (+),score=73.55 TRINITY_DN425_c0_g1_i1:53-685(+)
MSASTPKLTYFGIRGRAEFARITLAAANIEWEENTIDGAALGELKKGDKLTFKQVPLYEDGTVTLVQSIAIARYVARTNDLYGANAAEAAKIDVLVEGTQDALNKLVPLVFGGEPNPDAVTKFLTEVAPVWLGHFEAVLPEGEYFVGNKLSLADLAVFLVLEILANREGVVSAFPKLSALKAKVEAVEGVSKYITSDKRPFSKIGAVVKA